MAQAKLAAFETRVANTLEMLGVRASDTALDPLADPASACAELDALGEGEKRILRVAPALGAGDDAYAPAPRSPVWLVLTRGSDEVSLAPLCASDKSETQRRTVVSVTVELATRPCCDAAACSLEKTLASAWIHFNPGDPSSARRLLVAEELALQSDDARAVVVSVATRLGAILGAPVLEGGEPVEAAAPAAPEGEVTTPLTAAELSRFSLRMEGGDTRVLRDHASHGPKSSAKRLALSGGGLLVLAALAWAATARAVTGDQTSGEAFGIGVVAALLTLAGYAFFAVARFAGRYVAESAPLLAIARGRFVTLPWVARTGAVDRRPEGRFGAAIPIQELRGVFVRERDGGRAIELDTEHGQIDALTTAEPKVAAHWSEVLRRAMAADAHPAAGPTARQRARGRARPSPAVAT